MPRKKKRPPSRFDLAAYERGLTLFSTLILRVGVKMRELPGDATPDEENDAVGEVIDAFVLSLSSEDSIFLGQMIQTVQSVNWEKVAAKMLLRALTR
jgi:hypothetical protein